VSSKSAQRTFRAALAATAAAVVSAGVVAPQAAADPAVPANASEALKTYTGLAGQAEKLNEEHLRAQDDLKAKQSELDKANSDLTGARQAEEHLRGQVDLLTEASFEGARFNQLSALLVSDSQQDYLNRMSALGILADDNAETLASLSKAVTDADDAQRRATDAANAATKIVDDIAQRKSDLDKQVADARAQYKQLSSAERPSSPIPTTLRASPYPRAPPRSRRAT
jgi:predicted  nucleic acid-binding Zn-ribbon protein